jgi:hypothetical protein
LASLESAIKDLQQLLACDATSADWRWNVRRRLAVVKDALTAPHPQTEAWLAAREGTSNRNRRQLQARVGALAAGVLDRIDVDVIVSELRRLQTDLEHYVQRVHDLVYDSVSLELGGSE